MRKKAHRRINANNREYDRFYVINYLVRDLVVLGAGASESKSKIRTLSPARSWVKPGRRCRARTTASWRTRTSKFFETL